MDDLRRELAALSRRARLQGLVGVGAITVLVFAMGGADVVARTFVEADSWRIRTKNTAETTFLDRIVVTTGADTARVKIQNANIELAQQASAPPTTTAGAIWYDSTAGKLKYRNASAWVDVGPAHTMVYKPSDETVNNSSTLQNDDHLTFAIGANEKWEADFLLKVTTSGTPDFKVAISSPAGATVTMWLVGAPTGSDPTLDIRTWVTSGTSASCGISSSIDNGIFVHASVSNGGTAGNVTLQWAQNTAQAADTTVMAGSAMEATRIQ